MSVIIINSFWQAAAFTPLAYSPIQWHDASDSTTLFDATSGGSLPSNGGAVARWEDKSGNANHFTSASAQPARETSSQNGLDSLVFSGDSMIKTGIAAPSALTFFCVAQTSDWTGGANPYQCLSSHNYTGLDSDGIAHFFITGGSGPDWSDNNYLAFGDGYGAGQNPRAISPSTSGSDFRVVAVHLSSSLAQIAINGTTVSTSAGTAAVSSTSGTMAIGNNAAGTEGWGGKIAERILYHSHLDSTQTANVTNYLKSKWGIA